MKHYKWPTDIGQKHSVLFKLKRVVKPNVDRIAIAIWLGTATALMTSGYAGDRYHQSTGEHIDDRATSMRVKSALADDAQCKYPLVEVKTFKGTVQLSGFDLAKQVEGVNNVENKIIVKEKL